MTPAELRRLEQTATPGPWSDPYYVDDEPGDNGGWVHNGREGAAEYAVALTLPYSPKMREDAELIAAARNALPALLDMVEAAQDVADWAARQKGTPVLTKPLVERLAAALSRLEGDSDE